MVNAKTLNAKTTRQFKRHRTMDTAKSVALRPDPPLLTITMVFVGGALGAGARYLLTAFPLHNLGKPWSTLIINLCGAFLLAGLLEILDRRCTARLRLNHKLRAFLGTGMLGGFTTYSALTVDTVLWMHHNEIGLALGYSLGSLVLGVFGAWCGTAVGQMVARHGSRS